MLSKESLLPLIGHTITGIELIPRTIDFSLGKISDDDPQIVLVLDNKHKAYINASFGEYTGNSRDEYPILNSITLELNHPDLMDSRDIISETLILEGFTEKVQDDETIFYKEVVDPAALSYLTTYAFIRPQERDNLWLFQEVTPDLTPFSGGEWAYLNLKTSAELRTFLKIIGITDESSIEPN